MTGQPVAAGKPHRATHPIVTVVATEGSASHTHLRRLGKLDSAAVTRNAADALHHLAMLHGRQPGVVDHATLRTPSDDARRGLMALADAFVIEREFLGRLVVGAGPLPSTPGQAETEAAVIAQRHAIEMLAQSEREGCSLGAAIALAIEWHGMRAMFEASARRFGVDVPKSRIAPLDDLIAIVVQGTSTPAAERAALFGAQQIAVQHHGLWNLLEARAKARTTD